MLDFFQPQLPHGGAVGPWVTISQYWSFPQGLTLHSLLLIPEGRGITIQGVVPISRSDKHPQQQPPQAHSSTGWAGKVLLTVEGRGITIQGVIPISRSDKHPQQQLPQTHSSTGWAGKVLHTVEGRGITIQGVVPISRSDKHP